MDSDFFAKWLGDNHRFLDALLAAVARRQGLRGDDTDDFAGWATLRLIENDYALPRKWRGESQLTTYLTVVATNLGREYRVKHWGRFRPSAAAERLGPVAIVLERLVYRDGLTLHEAAERMRSAEVTALSDRALAELLAQLPRRAPPQRVADGDPLIQATPGRASAESGIEAAESDEQWLAVRRALSAAIARLTPLQRLIVRMHLLEGHTLADVARALNVEQRPLYRMKDAALATLRRTLTDAGVRWDDLRALFDGPRPDDEPDERSRDDAGDGPDDAPGTAALRPRGPRPPVGDGTAGQMGGSRLSNESHDARTSAATNRSQDSARLERPDT